MSVHYRFKSALEYDTITFDGLHISVNDLKNAIIQQKRIGKSTDFDLQVTNAQTKEVYEDETALIPKNTSLLIARIPVLVPKAKQWDGYGGSETPPTKQDDGGPLLKAADLSNLDAPEDDKIKAMMSQSTQDYDPSNYMKIRGANQMGPVPPNYRCYKCHQGGHWIKDCPLGQGGESIEIKKSTGIPQSFMVPVEGPHVQGAMMAPNGQYAVPVLDHQAYTQKNPNPAPIQESKPEIPEDLICSICSDLLADAVMIPCCGNSFCDECIRCDLLESEDHECPDCHEKDISPGTLIPNRFLRKSVANFKNTTGYEKKPIFREKVVEAPQTELPKKEASPPPQVDSSEKEKNKLEEEKTVISEADSTEHTKSDDGSKDGEPEVKRKNSTETDSIPEGPPGVSPSRMSPKHHISSKITTSNSSRDSREVCSRHPKYRDDSPKKHTSHRHKKSPPYSDSGLSEDRQGTPTRDEPPGVAPNFSGPNAGPAPYNSTSNNTIPPMMPGGGPPIQGSSANMPPGAFPPGQPPVFPPNQGPPPPNFRLPPPGAVGPPFMPPGPFPVSQRPVFEPRMPSGPPPNFSGFGSRGPPHSRDFGGRRVSDRTPPGIIDDPLAAFNRMLRLKDERDRRKRNLRRSYSRSRSRSRSFSPSPRRRSRSPRRRKSRSRSRSPFTLSRSRSRSYSLSPRGSPYRPLSPAASRRSPLPPLRKGPPRYRSPPRSPPPRRHIEPRGRQSRERDYGPRDFNRDDRNYREKDRRDDRDRDIRDRDRDRFYDNFDDRRGVRHNSRGPMEPVRGPPPQPQNLQPPPWNQPPRPEQNYYPPPGMPPDQQSYQNRYPQRDYGPPPHLQPPPRRYEDIGPPGLEQPPIPGLEPEQPPIRFEKPPERPPPHLDNSRDKPLSPRDRDRGRDNSRERVSRRKKSRTPEKWRNPSPAKDDEKRRKDESPDKYRRRKRHSSSPEERKRDKDKERDHSDDDKKKSKDKKKHKDKKETEKRKKREKKDKHKKSDKDKKSKESEFKQVIPKNADDAKSEEPKKQLSEAEESEKKRLREERERQIEEKRKRKEEEEKKHEEKRLEEEKKKEERRLRFLEDEKKLKLEQESKIKEEEEKLKKSREMEEQKLKKQNEVQQQKQQLYDDQDMNQEDINTTTIQTYAKIENNTELDDGKFETEADIGDKEFEEEESGILELHSTDIDLKTELDKSDILAPVPEKSKWEEDEYGQIQTSPNDSKEKSDPKSVNKVTTEVLKRAENAIFAKAINAIRPIEIKKISSDRAKLYTDEKAEDELIVMPQKIDLTVEKPKLSIKDRLGVKVDDTDRVVLIDSRNRSRTISPFSRRERKQELDEFRRHDRNRRSRSRRREHSRERRRVQAEVTRRSSDSRRRRSEHRDRKDKDRKHADDKREKKKRSRSRSENSEDRKEKRRKREKKVKKEKDNKKKEADKEEKDATKTEESEPKPLKSATMKRKPTLDEASFEPDYDLELHTDDATSETEDKDGAAKASAKKDEESSSSESSSSSSEEDRKKKRHKKHSKKKKKRVESSSDSSESSSDSSDSEKDKKRRRHKKTKKKKKKSRHK